MQGFSRSGQAADTQRNKNLLPLPAPNLRIEVLHTEAAMPMPPHLSPPSRADAARERPGSTVAAALAAWVAGVDRLALFGESRGGAQVAAARQLAIYLAHVALGYDLTRLAAAFGRDRATLRHALRRIEDERDDPAFDRQLTGLEAILHAAAARDVSGPEDSPR
jgi:hypothetical protein